jgi:hypothetical protein
MAKGSLMKKSSDQSLRASHNNSNLAQSKAQAFESERERFCKDSFPFCFYTKLDFLIPA